MRAFRNIAATLSAVAIAAFVGMPPLPAASSYAADPENESSSSSSTSDVPSNSSQTDDSSSSSSAPSSSSSLEDPTSPSEDAENAGYSETADDGTDDPDDKDEDKDKERKLSGSEKDALKKVEKGIKAAEDAERTARSAISSMGTLEGSLSSSLETYQTYESKADKLKEKVKKVEKALKKTDKKIAKAKMGIAAIDAALADNGNVISEMFHYGGQLSDVDSREYLLKKVRSAYERDIDIYNGDLAALDAQADEVGADLDDVHSHEAEIAKDANEVALKIEAASSQTRSSDKDATKAFDSMKGSAKIVERAKESDKKTPKELKEGKKELEKAQVAFSQSQKDNEAARTQAYAALEEWYSAEEKSADQDPEDIITFGTGADFMMGKEAFVAKWAPAIEQFYKDYNEEFNLDSPLGEYASKMVETAYDNRIDPRMCAAVSIIESSGGVYCIKPHNAWGWGAYDSDPRAGAETWDSWEDAIKGWHEGVRGAAAGYISMPALDAFGATYCSGPDWPAKVAEQMQKITDIATDLEESDTWQL